MKTFRHWAPLLGVLLGAISLVSCKEEIDGNETPVFLSSYIVTYYDCPLVISDWSIRDNSLDVNLNLNTDGVFYHSPDLGLSRGEENDSRFLEIAERNGDRSYNKMEGFSMYCSRDCTADNFTSMQVVCSDKAWDSNHPAGTSLSDVVTVYYSTYARYIRSGYVGLVPVDGFRKPLTELQADDLTMISPYLTLYFDSYPSSGKYTLEVTMVTTDGEEKRANHVIDFDKKKTDWPPFIDR